jgi:hypothetical protein
MIRLLTNGRGNQGVNPNPHLPIQKSSGIVSSQYELLAWEYPLWLSKLCRSNNCQSFIVIAPWSS